MIFVSVFHAIAWFPTELYFLLMSIDPTYPFLVGLYYVGELIACVFVSTNPFIYATKFEPVKKVLLRMVPCKALAPEQATEHTINSSKSGSLRPTLRVIHVQESKP